MIEHASFPDLPPQGFEPMMPPGIFLNRAAQFFGRKEDDGAVTVGTRITPNQANSLEVAHGGFLLTFADFAFTYVLTAITLNLSADFLAPVPVGAWLEARIVARRRSATLIFADTVATVEGIEVMRMNALLRPFEKRNPPSG